LCRLSHQASLAILAEHHLLQQASFAQLNQHPVPKHPRLLAQYLLISHLASLLTFHVIMIGLRSIGSDSLPKRQAELTLKIVV
jgi:hypothetical protein